MLCAFFLGISNERNIRNVNTLILPAPKISHENYICVKERQQYYLTSSICKMWLFQRTKRRQNVIIKEFDGGFLRILCAIKPKNSIKIVHHHAIRTAERATSAKQFTSNAIAIATTTQWEKNAVFTRKVI